MGTDPGPTFVGNFNGQTDLVTVNAGSNDLTLISGFEGSNPVTSTIASGGVDPETAFAFSAGSGFEDLVVGNAGDGELALFEGGPDGLGLTSAATEPNLPDPTALAFSALTGGQVQFYAATAGRESAELVALSLGIETATDLLVRRVVVRKFGGPTGAAARVVAAAGGDGADAHDRGVGRRAQPRPGGDGGPGRWPRSCRGRASPWAKVCLSRRAAAGGDDVRNRTSRSGCRRAVPAVIAPWERFVIGLDEALEEQEREGAGGLMGPSEPGDRPAPSPRGGHAGGRAAGRGCARSRTGRRAPRWEDPAVSLPANPTGAIDAVNARNQNPWRRGSDRDSAGRRDRRGDRDPGCRSVGRPPRRGPTPRSPARDRIPPACARVRRRLPPGVPTGAPVWRDLAIRLRPRGGGSAGSPSPSCESPRRRSKGYPADAASRWWTMSSRSIRTRGRYRLRPSSREPTGPVPSPTGAGAESIQ